MAGFDFRQDGNRRSDLFDCQVCYDDITTKTPRCLSCLLAFCEECLQRLLYQTYTGEITCPTCRRITTVPEGDVTRLTRDFRLIQMKEREEQLATSQGSMQLALCQVCNQRPAQMLCKDCSQKLCLSCKENHDNFSDFKEHVMKPLCSEHKQELTHLCHSCMKTVCRNCIMLSHLQHKTSVENIAEGVNKLKAEVGNLHTEVAQKMTKLEGHLDTEEAILTHIHTVKNDIAIRKETCRNIMEEADITLEHVEEEYENPTQQSIEMSRDLYYRTLQIVGSLAGGAYEGEAEFVENYRQRMREGQEVSILVDEQVERKSNSPPFSVADDSHDSLLQAPQRLESTETSQAISTGQPKLLLELQKSGLTVYKSPEQVLFLGRNTIVVNDWNLQYVSKMDLDGNMVARYYPTENEFKPLGISVHDANLYIVQPVCITKINVSPNAKKVIETYKPNLDGMSKMHTNDGVNFIISSFHQGTVHTYNMDSNVTKLVVENLEGPNCVLSARVSDISYYVVVERKKHKVHVYSDTWEEISVFGGEGEEDDKLKWPASVVMTPQGTLLVTDTGNNRVSQFTLDGTFLCHILKGGDQVRSPTGLAYRYPYVWLTEKGQGHGAVKCFQL